MEWLQTNWSQLVVCLYAFESILAFVSKFTPWQWDNNLAGWLGSLLAKFFPKSQ